MRKKFGKDKAMFNEAKMRALFLLADIEIKSVYRLENAYWPLHPDYDDTRRSSPWFLVQTGAGMVKIGWRKRVLSISWSDTKVRGIITDDDVTKDPELVHAWGYGKAVEYLTRLGMLINVEPSSGNVEAGAVPVMTGNSDSEKTEKGIVEASR